MDKQPSHTSSKPFYLLLLPLFFVVHGYVEHAYVQPAREAIELFFIYAASGLVLSLIFWLFYKNLSKAALAAFTLLAFNFFFGAAHDFLKQTPGIGFLSRYSIILPGFLLAYGALLFFLWKRDTTLSKLTRYLNILFLVLIGMELLKLTFLIPGQEHVSVPVAGTLQNKTNKVNGHPDIYLIVVDEYAGKQELKDLFAYDNAPFEVELEKRGFSLAPDSRSNYNWTAYSIASTLNMGYLSHLEKGTISNNEMYDCASLIRGNQLVNFLKQQQYSLYNHSIFDIDDQHKAADPLFLPSKRSLFTAQTFLFRFQRNIGFHFAAYGKIESIKKAILKDNEKLISLTKGTAGKKAEHPKFVYTHLLMPHHPYYFDSTGAEAPPSAWEDENKTNRTAYISYLKYANKRLLQLIDTILSASENPPLIILMSDHGFRQIPDSLPRQYHFMNLSAVLMPPPYKGKFQPARSNVNQFRVVLNSVFDMQLPLLQDSTQFLKELPR